MNEVKIGCQFCSARNKSIFSDLNLADSGELALAKNCMTFKKGQVIFEEDAYPHGLYCINDGKIKLVQNGTDGKEHIIHLAKTGDVMGYRAILSGDKYSCSAVAIETSNICFIPVKFFIGMVEKNAKLVFKIIHLFSDQLKIAEHSINDMAQKTVKERLAQSILLLKETYGFEPDGSTINITITREEVASIVGTARETATRLLAELSKEKSIELDGKKIKILSQEKLIRAANVF